MQHFSIHFIKRKVVSGGGGFYKNHLVNHNTYRQKCRLQLFLYFSSHACNCILLQSVSIYNPAIVICFLYWNNPLIPTRSSSNGFIPSLIWEVICSNLSREVEALLYSRYSLIYILTWVFCVYGFLFLVSWVKCSNMINCPSNNPKNVNVYAGLLPDTYFESHNSLTLVAWFVRIKSLSITWLLIL